jgi:ABC-type transporter Mla subunit MlaD
MKRTEIEALLRDHVRGVHEELANLFRGVERALNQHLERTESMIADAFASERDELENRLINIERRLTQLEQDT